MRVSIIREEFPQYLHPKVGLTSKKRGNTEVPFQTCPLCAEKNPIGSRFCSACGVEMESGLRSVAPGEAVLVSVRAPDGDGSRFRIKAPGATLGSGQVELCFAGDRLLEPRHARFFYRQGRLYMRDEGTLNGSYLRLRSTLKLESGDMFICGAQLLRYVEQKQRIPSDEAPVRLLTSPTRIAPFRIEHILRGGQLGSVAYARAGRVVIGREDADLSFQHDLYLSGHHACVEKLTSTATVLMDLGSKNGTFRRIRGPEVLTPGDLVFVGRQLFRIEFQRPT